MRATPATVVLELGMPGDQQAMSRADIANHFLGYPVVRHDIAVGAIAFDVRFRKHWVFLRPDASCLHAVPPTIVHRWQ